MINNLILMDPRSSEIIFYDDEIEGRTNYPYVMRNSPHWPTRDCESYVLFF